MRGHIAHKLPILLLAFVMLVGAGDWDFGQDVPKVIIMSMQDNTINATFHEGQQFFACDTNSISDTWCRNFYLNASTFNNTANLTISWTEGNGTVCDVWLLNSTNSTLANLTNPQTYTLPSTYQNGSNFSVRITWLKPSTEHAKCHFTLAGN